MRYYKWKYYLDSRNTGGAMKIKKISYICLTLSILSTTCSNLLGLQVKRGKQQRGKPKPRINAKRRARPAGRPSKPAAIHNPIKNPPQSRSIVSRQDNTPVAREQIRKNIVQATAKRISEQPTLQRPGAKSRPPRKTPRKRNPVRNFRSRPTRNRQRSPHNRARAPRQPVDDHFVESLHQEGVVQAHAKMQDGSYVVQIKTAKQKGATCPAMALRSGQFVLNYLLTGKIGYLKQINNAADMNNYIRQMTQKKLPHKNLHSKPIEKILKEYKLGQLEQYNKTNNIVVNASKDNTLVIDNDALMNLLAKVQNRVDSIHLEDDWYGYCFIARLGATEQKIKNMKKAAKSGGHWISISVTKRHGKLYWFVCESGAVNRVNVAKAFAKKLLGA